MTDTERIKVKRLSMPQRDNLSRYIKHDSDGEYERALRFLQELNCPQSHDLLDDDIFHALWERMERDARVENSRFSKRSIPPWLASSITSQWKQAIRNCGGCSRRAAERVSDQNGHDIWKRVRVCSSFLLLSA